MTGFCSALFLCLQLHARLTGAFVPSSKTSRRVSVAELSVLKPPSFLPELPNPFEKFKVAAPEDTLGESFEPSPAGLIRQAKRVVASDLGLQDSFLLDDSNFRWIGPVVDQPLSKTEYLAAGRFFDLRAAFPDLDYRAHDYRIDEDDPATVRVTSRVVGTMRGDLRLRDQTLSPNGKTMKCPPEAITIKFDLRTGKVIKMCSGFAMDRLVGNTAGRTGVMAAATVAGAQISDWEVYPPITVIRRFFGRPVAQLPDAKTFLAPFPETVMIQLAKGILASGMASEDPTLLSDDFTYCTPIVGPIRKAEFIEKYAAEEFENVDPSFSHWRVDPYDPVRVWVDVQPSAQGYEGAPQAMSFTFDDEGFCTRITTGAVMDPSIGNGGGLGGPEGYKYATGQGSPAIATRPLPRVLGRLRKRLLQPLTGVDVDDYILPGRKDLSSASQRASSSLPAVASERMSPVEKLSSLRARVASSPAPASTTGQQPQKEIPAFQQPLPQLSILKPFVDAKGDAERKRKKDDAKKAVDFQARLEQTSFQKAGVERQKQLAMQKAEAERQRIQEAARAQQLSVKKANADRKRQEAAAQAEARKKQLEAQRVKAEEKQKEKAAEAKKAAAQKAEAERNRQQAQAKAQAEEEEKRRRAAAEKALAAQRQKDAIEKAEAERRKIAEKRQRELEAQREAQIQAKREQEEANKLALQKKQEAAKAAQAARKKAEDQSKREQAALDIVSQAASKATIALFGLGQPTRDDDQEAPVPPTSRKQIKKAPPGVPTISRWRRNFDGTITGNISGSKSFNEGEKITTSPIAKGLVVPGEVVTTGSGSRYFLS